jgi:hypothetical protein
MGREPPGVSFPHHKDPHSVKLSAESGCTLCVQFWTNALRHGAQDELFDKWAIRAAKEGDRVHIPYGLVRMQHYPSLISSYLCSLRQAEMRNLMNTISNIGHW